jgi:hypothetical protein
VLSLVWLWGVTSVLAVILGLVARRQIKERNESGDGMAIAGIIVGIIGIIVPIGIIILIAAFVDDNDSFDEFENFEMIRTAVTALWYRLVPAG